MPRKRIVSNDTDPGSIPASTTDSALVDETTNPR
jgi:hypothetical protein